MVLQPGPWAAISGNRTRTLWDDSTCHVWLSGSDSVVHVLEEWPLDKIISAREAFFAFLQECWSAFLDRMVTRGQPKTVSENRVAYGLRYSGPLDLPFDHDDVRVYVENLFLEGLLYSVSRDNVGDLTSTWVGIGIRTDSAKDRRRRLDGLIETIRDTIPTGDARHADWLRFGYVCRNQCTRTRAGQWIVK